MRYLALLVLVLGVGCSSYVQPDDDAGADAPRPQAGTEGGPCYGNGTCNPPLACASNICVLLPDAGATDVPGPTVHDGPVRDSSDTGVGDGVSDTTVDSNPDLPPSGAILESVINSMSLPTKAGQYALDLDGSGAKNQFGSLLAAMAGFGLDMQPALTSAINDGSLIYLLDVLGTDLNNDNNVALNAYLGLDTDGNASNNFSGSATLQTDPAWPAMTLGGAIVSGKLSVGPGTLAVPIMLQGSPLLMNAQAARIEATVSLNGITNGVMAGAIPESDLDGTIFPAVADLINGLDVDTKKTVLGLMDTNKDGVVDVAEIKDSLVGQALAPDIDTDGDGIPDSVSLGYGFSAVTCQIQHSTGVTCWPGFCPGCCQGNTCLLFGQQSDTACGRDGLQCAPCGSTTPTCMDGVCQGCNANTCGDGCCSGNQCLHVNVEQSTAACGNGGNACTACPTDHKCIDGACMIPWRVIAVSAEVLPDGNPDTWDENTGGSPPDPKASCTVVGGKSGETQPVTDSYVANWNQELFTESQARLQNGLTCEVLDDDWPWGAEVMGTCSFSLSFTSSPATFDGACSQFVKSLKLQLIKL